ncbi:hypothetical protein JB92DRAFT_1997674 [Gautieria morchelliformis]|nr:hypothetical protein JB92DRAFT_1997674 [Gautieria morchelliformis]
MAAFPPNADLALAPPPAPSRQSATPSAAPSATPSVPSAPQPAPLLPNGGCPKCGSLRGNKDCSVGYCKKCCVKNALGNPGRAPCNYRAHQLHRNGYAHQPAILPAPSLPIATLPSSCSLPIVSSPPIASAILAAPDLPPTRNLSNPLPSGWADARMRSLQIEQNTLNHAQQLQDSHIMLQQSYNLVWYAQPHIAPLVLTIQLNSLYMSLKLVKSTHFDLMEILGLHPNSLCYAYVQGEWRAHQMGTRWKVQPGQCLLYQLYELPLEACLNLDRELK